MGINLVAGPILDIGCGTGRSMKLLHNITGGLVVGIDVNPVRLKIAKEVYEESSLVCGDAKLLPFRNSCFKLVSLINTLHELKAELVDSLLNEVRRILVDKGLLLIVDKCFLPELKPWEELTILTEKAYHEAKEAVYGIRSFGIHKPSEIIEFISLRGFRPIYCGIWRIGRRLSSTEFFMSWGKKTFQLLGMIKDETIRTRIAKLISRIRKLASKYGYGPAPVIVALFEIV